MQQHNDAEVKQFLQGQKKEYQRRMDEVRKVGTVVTLILVGGWSGACYTKCNTIIILTK